MVDTPGLWLWRSPRMEALAEHLCDALRTVPEDPMAPQRVVVGSKGMSRWLKHRIATSLGICAHVEFQFIQAALLGGLDQLLGSPEDSNTVETSPEILAWTILAALQDKEFSATVPEVTRYLSQEPGTSGANVISRRTWAWARATGDILERYGIYRPDWVVGWNAASSSSKTLVGPQPEAWQVKLWKRAHKHLGARPLALRVEEARKLVEARKQGEVQGPLHLFGLSSFSPVALHMVGLLARVVPVHLYSLTPSHEFMGDLKARSAGLRGIPLDERSQRVEELLGEGEMVGNTLVSTCGRLARDFQVLLELSDVPLQEMDPNLGAPDAEPTNALEQVQRDIYALLGPRLPEERIAVEPEDTSIQIHACHGPTRQVEVLRDALLDVFNAHPDIEPRDVVVMTPDISTYAPLVDVVFRRGPEERDPDGTFGGAGAPSIPVEISDRSLTEMNPVADVLLRALGMVDARLDAAAVLDLLALPLVRTRYALEEEDIPVVRAMLVDAGVRWGDDAVSRAKDLLGGDAPKDHPLMKDDQNTWAFGMERLALSVASSSDAGLFEGRLAAASVEGQRVDVLGSFLSFVRCLQSWRATLQTPATITSWTARLKLLLSDMVEPEDDATWLVDQVVSRLDEMAQGAESGAFDGLVSVGAVLRALEGNFENPQKGDRPITGAVTLCSMSPMRSVPFRVVCLLGLDDGVFPRKTPVLGLDAVTTYPRLGDRNPRDEDRHEFLEAILSARTHFMVIYGARDPANNDERPPCAPVADLLETLDGTFLQDAAPELPGHVAFLHEHPLQPFSPANFTVKPGQAPRSFDATALATARRLQGEREAPQGIFGYQAGGSIPALPLPEVTLEQLESYFTQPAATLLRTRLGLTMRDFSDELAAREPTGLDNLEVWQFQDAFLKAALSAPDGVSPVEHAATTLQAKGLLPLGAGAAPHLEKASLVTRLLMDRAPSSPRAPVRAEVNVPNAWVTGLISNVDTQGALTELTFEKPDKAKHLVKTWLRLLVASAANVEGVESAVVVGIQEKAKQPELAELTLSKPSNASEILGRLVALYQQGLTRPLRYAPKATQAFAAKLEEVTGAWDTLEEKALQPAIKEAQGQWEAAMHHGGGESGDGNFAALFGGTAPWEPTDATNLIHPEFLHVAETLWKPIFQAVVQQEPATPKRSSKTKVPS